MSSEICSINKPKRIANLQIIKQKYHCSGKLIIPASNRPGFLKNGADDGIRTHDINLGKVALYP